MDKTPRKRHQKPSYDDTGYSTTSTHRLLASIIDMDEILTSAGAREQVEG
jgi:hypothetical protein